ncbi:hypothetical protein HD593_008398 [Nonomuraea rubra]|uniref:Uncharacterized protein n=1 Tax=Nonomuraea rubra TaxID=46180 RepID=A0A7X0U3E1_9ACTN|nr:hypothetical protein [Nonomuraea rubra]MBB6553603.1 hypothetical protein [Nonomuraea rubra]
MMVVRRSAGVEPAEPCRPHPCLERLLAPSIAVSSLTRRVMVRVETPMLLAMAEAFAPAASMRSTASCCSVSETPSAERGTSSGSEAVVQQ